MAFAWAWLRNGVHKFPVQKLTSHFTATPMRTPSEPHAARRGKFRRPCAALLLALLPGIGHPLMSQEVTDAQRWLEHAALAP